MKSSLSDVYMSPPRTFYPKLKDRQNRASEERFHLQFCHFSFDRLSMSPTKKFYPRFKDRQNHSSNERFYLWFCHFSFDPLSMSPTRMFHPRFKDRQNHSSNERFICGFVTFPLILCLCHHVTKPLYSTPIRCSIVPKNIATYLITKYPQTHGLKNL